MMTALGGAELLRANFACPGCGQGGFRTRQAAWLVSLAGGQHAFAAAERLLKTCCGWSVSDETIRDACQAEARRIAESRATSPTLGVAFATAAGDVEFQVDAAKVHTTQGWRDMKIGIFARRERGEKATPEQGCTSASARAGRVQERSCNRESGSS